MLLLDCHIVKVVSLKLVYRKPSIDVVLESTKFSVCIVIICRDSVIRNIILCYLLFLFTCFFHCTYNLISQISFISLMATTSPLLLALLDKKIHDATTVVAKSSPCTYNICCYHWLVLEWPASPPSSPPLHQPLDAFLDCLFDLLLYSLTWHSKLLTVRSLIRTHTHLHTVWSS